MKTTLKNTTRLLMLLLSFLLLATTAILPISAETTSWELFGEGEEQITNGTALFSRRVLPSGYLFRPHTSYLYADPIEIVYGYYTYDVMVYATGKADPGIVWLSGYLSDEEDFRIYVEESKAASLDAFLNGTASQYYLTADSDRDEIAVTPGLIAQLDANTAEGKTVAVRSLRNEKCYRILGYDESLTVCFVYGVIYQIEDSLYYLNYQRLSNNYFDADGNFSYRQGEVTLLPLTDELDGAIRTELTLVTPYACKADYEEGEIFLPEASDENSTLFWTVFVLLGFVLPCVPLIFGWVSARRTKSKDWYSMMIAAGAWMLFALILLILLL